MTPHERQLIIKNNIIASYNEPTIQKSEAAKPLVEEKKEDAADEKEEGKKEDAAEKKEGEA